MQINDPEVWKAHPEFHDYELSSLGRIRRGKRLLNPILHGKYLQATLWHLGIGTQRTVHSLIAETFIGPLPHGKQVNHKDLNRVNCRADNLEYVTPLENTRHAMSNGVKVGGLRLHGQDAAWAKLSNSQADEIRIKYSSGGHSYSGLAKDYHVSSGAIAHVVKRRSYNHHD